MCLITEHLLSHTIRRVQGKDDILLIFDSFSFQYLKLSKCVTWVKNMKSTYMYTFPVAVIPEYLYIFKMKLIICQRNSKLKCYSEIGFLLWFLTVHHFSTTDTSVSKQLSNLNSSRRCMRSGCHLVHTYLILVEK